MKKKNYPIVLVAISMALGLFVSCNWKLFKSSDEELGSKQANRYVIMNEKIDKFGFIDADGQVIISPQFDDVEPFSCGLALVEVNEKYGFIDPQGGFVIGPIYEDAESFSEEMAAVSRDGDHFGFIDTKGNEVIPPIYDYVNSFSDGVALVLMGDPEDGTYAYIDKEGKVVISPVGGSDWDYYDYKNGLAKVGINDKYGFVDKKFKFVVNPMYDDANDFSEGLAAVELNDRWGFVNAKGEVCISIQYEDVGDFHEGLASFKVGEKYGFLDKKGNVAIPPQFQDVSDFHNGWTPVKVGDKVGYIDKNGNYLVAPHYDYGFVSEGDVVMVFKEKKDESLTILYLDMKGNPVWQVTRKYFNYTSGFETADDYWTFVGGTQANQWVIGQAVSKDGRRSMYISNDNGHTYGYDGGAGSVVFAYKTLELNEGRYVCEFDWKCVGEGSSCDYMRVALVPDNVTFTPGQMGGFGDSSTPDDWIDIDGGDRMYDQSSWTHHLKEFRVKDGTYKLVFMWRNDGSVTNAPPAIDNVTVKEKH